MKEGQIIRTIQNNGEKVTFRYPRWQDVPAYVEMCNILHQERVMAYHAETSFAKGCERLSGILVDLETGKTFSSFNRNGGANRRRGKPTTRHRTSDGNAGNQNHRQMSQTRVGQGNDATLRGGRSKVRFATDLLACLASERGCH